MKQIIAFLFCYSSAFALQAPYLISATPLTDSSIQLSWRNNDNVSEGFIIVRRSMEETDYSFIDSVRNPTTLTYVDRPLQNTTTYAYRIIAYGGGKKSDSSNIVSATTFARLTADQAPTIMARWDASGSVRVVRLTIVDNSKCEEGYAIFQSDSGIRYQLIGNIPSINPLKKDTIIWNDSSIHTPRQRWYKVAAYQGSDSVWNWTVLKKLTARQNDLISSTWDTSGGADTVRVAIADRSFDVEDGFTVFRSIDKGMYQPAYTHVCFYCGIFDTIRWNDPLSQINTTYSYKVATFQGSDTLWDSTSQIYTYKPQKIDSLIQFNKISGYPISYGGLTVVTGDSIILKESNAPADAYSIIDISNIKSPSFRGYIDSIQLLSYPAQTLIPAYLRFKVYNTIRGIETAVYKNKIWVLKDKILYCAQMDGKALVIVDSLRLSYATRLYHSFGDDNLLINCDSAVFVYGSTAAFSVSSVDYINKISVSNKIDYYVAKSDSSIFNSVNFMGLFDGFGYRAANTYYYQTDQKTSTVQLYTSGCTNGTARVTFSSDLWLNMLRMTNTGQLFSKYVGLYFDGRNFYGIDIRNLHSIQYSDNNNLTYTDSTPSAAGLLQNVILDTLTKRVYVFYQNYLSILGYNYVTGFSTKLPIKKYLTKSDIVPTKYTCSYIRHAFIIQSPGSAFSASLYDVSGHLLDRFESRTSSTISSWKPRAALSNSFYIVQIQSKETMRQFKIIGFK